MDNFRFDITSEGDDAFRTALSLTPRVSLTGYRVGVRNGVSCLVLYWTASASATPLPYAMDLAAAVEFVLGWLRQVDYGPQPDHDGSNGKGWRLYNEAWGHVSGEWEAFAVVEPCWAMYGK